MSDFKIKNFDNGLVLLGYEMPEVESAAMAICLPVGSACDPAGMEGSASVVSEWLMRGAGSRDSRALNEALDFMGVQHNESVSSEMMTLSASMLGLNLSAALDIYADIVLRPTLSEDAFDACRMLVTQDLLALEDEPNRKCTAMLNEKFYPNPLGRMSCGNDKSLAEMTAKSVSDLYRKILTPDGCIISVAGNFKWDELLADVERLFGSWQGPKKFQWKLDEPIGGVHHIEKDSAQTHISLAYSSVTATDEQYYAGRMAVGVLSMGMGSRLFTEVREKRGLAYHVSARYSAHKDCAGIICYAGTRPDLAQQSFDIITEELKKLGSDGVTSEELERAKTQMRSMMIMQNQSTAARAGQMASDWYYIGRLRSMEEINEKTLAVTPQDVLEHMQQHPADNYTVMTIGNEPLTIDN